MYVTNIFNKITAKDNSIIKEGPKSLLQGELYFYQHIPEIISDLFPKLIGYYESQNTIFLHIELINGCNLSNLLINKKLTHQHMKDLDDILTRIHNASNIDDSITQNTVAEFYKNKFLQRFKLHNYPESALIKEIILKFLKIYTTRIRITPVIHGDYWLSNIIITPNGDYKLIDMRGCIGNCLSLAGDPNYDYAKLYQSILGYDYVLYDKIENYDTEYKESLLTYYKRLLGAKKIAFEDIHLLTIMLILGNIPFIECDQKKKAVWNWALALIAKK
jgi:hypothetical protein